MTGAEILAVFIILIIALGGYVLGHADGYAKGRRDATRDCLRTVERVRDGV